MAFAEIHEADAPPELAALYARLRDAIRIPVVNLIWRHAATLPGVLPWMVAASEDVARSLTLRSMREALTAAAAGGDPLPDVAAALDPAARAQLGTVIETYNRGNATNLLLLTALRQAIAGAAIGGGAALPPDPSPPAMLPPLPAQPRIGALPPPVAEQVRALAARHQGIGDAIPSLYLHCALWPALLAPLDRTLAPLFADGTVARLRAALIAEAEAAAPRLLPAMTPPGPFPAEHREQMLSALAAFAGGLIAEMAGIGARLSHSLKAAR
jgi:hypothetical protein